MNSEGTLSARPRRGMARPVAIASVAVLCLSTLIPGTGVQAAPKPPPTCSLVPQLRDVTINQGVGAYTPLVRGKETLVRAYLAKPTCAAAGAIIELTGGSLSVTSANAPAVTISAPTPRPVVPYPQLAAATSAPLVDSTADPVWVVPGSVLAPSTTTARFTATFRVTINYQSKASATATPVAGSFTFTTRSGSTTPITATVEKLTNALRVLVVPMGDASQAFASQYTASGDSALQAAMLTLSRIYPVPEGVGSLTGTSGGLRYSVSPGMLDLRGLLGTDGRFCGTGGSTGNFNAIKASLGQFLQSWNAANGAANQADRVLGVVDAAISNGSALGCAEGMAAINSNEAWIRAVPELQGVPSQSGFVAALELGHTFGLVLSGPSPTPDRDDLFSRYHSPNVYADPQRTNRSYNTRLRSVLVDDRTAMTYIGTANNNNTLLEQLDWAYLICRLGGATSTECPTPAVPVGSGAGVAAGPRFVISGVTDGTAAGTEVLESFFSANMLPTPQNAASQYRLVYRSANGAILSNFGLPVQAEDSAHTHDDDGDEVGTALTLFSGAFDFPGTPQRIELWRGAPGTGVLLYTRDRTTAPVLTDIGVTPASGGPVNFTNDEVNVDFAPALSADGRWIAWPAYEPSEGTLNIVVRVAPTDDVSQQAHLSDGDDIDSTDPAWCSDGSRLAYVDPNDGGLWTIPVNTSSVPATFGTATLIYDAELPGNSVASHPTWSPDCSQIAFEADDDIWRLDSDGTDLVALTDDDNSHDPAWSPDPDDNRIAFVVWGFSGIGGGIDASGDDATYASFISPDPDPPTGVLDHGGTHFVVTSSSDPGDGVCDADCTLREAITAANGSTNLTAPDEIEFDIGGSPPHFISPTTALPVITDAVIIDGTTQVGYIDAPIIEINGSDTPAGTDGFTLGVGGDGSTIRGLAINLFTRDGIRNFDDDVVIDANYIGVGLDGTSDSGNGAIGVDSLNGSGLQISGNLIGGNAQHGISISGGTALDPVVDTMITDNLIGTDAAGTGALGNTVFGILLGSFSNGTVVGGLTTAERNVISANAFGIVVGIGADANVIRGNYIGTDVTGTADLGNVSQGIEVNQGTNTLIGGSAAGAGNVISGNGALPVGADGVRISGNQAIGNVIERNVIGLDATGTVALGNSDDGISIVGDATNNSILANAIDANGGLGIELEPIEGVNPNDADDSDTGANNLQNYPVLATAVGDAVDTTVEGSITGTPSTGYRVELFASDSCDLSSNGEGARFLNGSTVNTDLGGIGSFQFGDIPAADAAVGDFITATATDPEGNTSEFSACLIVSAEAQSMTVNATDDSNDGTCNATHCSLREAINAANGISGADTVSFDIGGGGAQTIDVDDALPPLTETATIDGTSQPGYDGVPLIAVDGAAAGIETSGLVIGSSFLTIGATIQGLAVVNFSGSGIDAQGDSALILDNYLGTADGTTAAPNGTGLFIGDGSFQSEVRGNLISGNAGAGIRTQGGELTIVANRIGTDATGASALPNDGPGTEVEDGDVRIGSGNVGEGNLISGNLGPGIVVVAQATIVGNRIGTNASGTAGVGNGAGGIEVDGGVASVGGSGAGTGNLISGNFTDGVLAHNDGTASLHGNLIGTNAAGTASIPNTGSGVTADTGGVLGSVGGPGDSRNVISGNAGAGVQVLDHPGTGELTTINENYIGTNASGTAALGNAVGVVVTNANTVIIGQDTGGSVISGNTGPGIIVNGTSTGTEIGNNRIGLNFAADLPIPNGSDGIFIESGASGTIVGMAPEINPGFGNIIGGNTDAGITINGSNGNVIEANLIGTNSEGTDLGNGGAGVSIINGGQGNRVGAAQSGTSIPEQGANIIAFNAGDGVEFMSGGALNASAEIHSNSIFDNDGLGIDLEADGITPNDTGDPENDPDVGANDLTNFPDLIEASSDGADTFGLITSTTAEDALIIVYQLFVSTSCDPTGNGEGERYLTTLTTNADNTGFAEASFSIPEDLEGMWLTATTSNVNGLTSEFSECFEVQGAGFGDEIRLLDPTTPLGTTEFVVDGFDPAWRSGSLLYGTDGEIHRIQPDGTGDETITSGSDFDYDPSGAPGVTAFVRTSDGGDDDVWLLVDGETVTVTATDQTPENLRLDLYYVCGGQSMPIAVALTPDVTGATTASFQTNYDPSLSCAGGTIEAALTDGFLRTTTPPGAGEPVASDPKPPVAATYGPPLGSTYLTSDVIPMHGIGEDADDGTLTGPSLRWFIRPASAPCCGTLAGTGGSVDFQAAGLAPGDYIVTLLATDPDGQTDTAESLIHVIADTDHDGFSDAQETNGCLAGGASDGSTPSGDADSDGLPNASDPDPCVAATVYNAIVDFNPNDLNLTSSGTPVTVFVQTPGRDIRQVVGSSVRIVEASGATTNLANSGWSVSGNVGTAKFARQPLVEFLKSKGVTTGTVWIVVSGSSNTNPTWSFTGRDTTNAKP